VIAAVVVSLVGGWVAWTLVVAQVPYEAALAGILPSAFKRTNDKGMPTFGLFASSVVMEIFLLMVVMADDVYLAALHITGLMIIPCYLFTGLFLLKKADNAKVRTIAVVTTLFCLWMAYAGGLLEMFMTSIFYLAGIGFYLKARRDDGFDRHTLVYPPREIPARRHYRSLAHNHVDYILEGGCFIIGARIKKYSLQ